MAAPRKVAVTPDADKSDKVFEFDGQTFTLRRKFKIGKFFKALETSPFDALALILEEESLEKFNELEMDMDDFKEFMDSLSAALSGTDSKN